MRRAFAFVVLLSSLAYADESDPVKAHQDRGVELYTAGDYAGAGLEFQAGYAIDPRPELLFAWAQAARKAGDCVQAAELFRTYIALRPGARQRAAAASSMVRCEESAPEEGLPAETEAPLPPEPEQEEGWSVVAPPPPPLLPPPVEQSRSVDRLGLGFLCGGLLVSGVGVLLYGASTSREDGLGNAATYADYEAAARTATTLRIAGAVTVGMGAGLLTYGIVRLVRGARQTPVDVVPVIPAGGGTGLAIEGVF